jgi:hypothetical protein
MDDRHRIDLDVERLNIEAEDVLQHQVDVDRDEQAQLRQFWRLDPADPLDDIDELAAATALLRRKIKPDRLDAVVRRHAPILNGRSLMEIASAGEFRLLRESVVYMFSLDRL